MKKKLFTMVVLVIGFIPAKAAFSGAARNASLSANSVMVDELLHVYNRISTPAASTVSTVVDEIPLNAAQKIAPYVKGGLDFIYPAGWFTVEPNVKVTLAYIRTIAANGTNVMYVANIDPILSTSAKTVVEVTKMTINPNGTVTIADADENDGVTVNLLAEEVPN